MFPDWLDSGCRYFRLTSCAVTVFVSGFAVKRITAVTLLSGKRLPEAVPPDGGGCEPPDGAALELPDPPAPIYAVTTAS